MRRYSMSACRRDSSVGRREFRVVDELVGRGDWQGARDVLRDLEARCSAMACQIELDYIKAEG